MPRITGFTNIVFEVSNPPPLLEEAPEAGDFITRAVRRPKKKIVKKMPERMRTIKRLVWEHADCYFDGWFNKPNILVEFEKLLKETNDRKRLNKELGEEDEIDFDEENIDEWADNNFEDDFIDEIFNDWETEISFFGDNECSLGTEFNVKDFIEFWTSATKYYKDEFDTDVQMKNEEHAWNTIAYWVVKSLIYDDYKTKFVSKYKEEYYLFKEENTRSSRIPCGVCYENKLLYTGCSTCNNNYLCRTCFIKCENECPFCRDGVMLMDRRATMIPCWTNNYWNGWDEKMKEIRADIPQAALNLLVGCCNECRKEIHWRDRRETIREEVDYAGDETYIYAESVLCIPCFNVWLENEMKMNKLKERKDKMKEICEAEYKDLDSSCPEGQDFQDWVSKLHFKIHDKIRKC